MTFDWKGSVGGRKKSARYVLETRLVPKGYCCCTLVLLFAFMKASIVSSTNAWSPSAVFINHPVLVTTYTVLLRLEQALQEFES